MGPQRVTAAAWSPKPCAGIAALGIETSEAFALRTPSKEDLEGVSEVYLVPISRLYEGEDVGG